MLCQYEGFYSFFKGFKLLGLVIVVMGPFDKALEQSVLLLENFVVEMMYRIGSG